MKAHLNLTHEEDLRENRGEDKLQLKDVMEIEETQRQDNAELVRGVRGVDVAPTLACTTP